jgi:NAD-dependent DNA ligase
MPRQYNLDTNPKILKDPNGQPRRLFKFNHENNLSKAIDQLSGICAGILADGVVCDKEAFFFKEWVEKYAELEPVYPFTEILKRIHRIFSDGVIDAAEKEELSDIMRQITGRGLYSDPSQNYSSELPLDAPLPAIQFEASEFVITGRFGFGTRAKVAEEITSRKGVVKDGFPSYETRYLVIGIFASRDWITTNYGRKIERAVELKNGGSDIKIISEDHWKTFII